MAGELFVLRSKTELPVSRVEKDLKSAKQLTKWDNYSRKADLANKAVFKLRKIFITERKGDK